MNDYARRKMYDRMMRRDREYDRRDYNERGNSYYPYPNPNEDYRNGRDYDYHRGKMETEYDYDIYEGIERLKRHDRFGTDKKQIIQKAREMGIRFDKYTEEEFVFMYYYLVSEFKNLFNDAHQYINMTKTALEQEGIAVDPSSKVAVILEEIVLGR